MAGGARTERRCARQKRDSERLMAASDADGSMTSVLDFPSDVLEKVLANIPFNERCAHPAPSTQKEAGRVLLAPACVYVRRQFRVMFRVQGSGA